MRPPSSFGAVSPGLVAGRRLCHGAVVFRVENSDERRSALYATSRNSRQVRCDTSEAAVRSHGISRLRASRFAGYSSPRCRRHPSSHRIDGPRNRSPEQELASRIRVERAPQVDVRFQHVQPRPLTETSSEIGAPPIVTARSRHRDGWPGSRRTGLLGGLFPTARHPPETRSHSDIRRRSTQVPRSS